MFRQGPVSPTLLDVVMLTGMKITGHQQSAYSYSDCTHRLKMKFGWKKYMEEHNKQTGPVSDREHTAFLNMWLEHFVLCGSTLGPTSNYQALAECLVQGTNPPISKYLLGAVYYMLYQTQSLLASHSNTVGDIGGPWWFLQFWVRIQFQQTLGYVPNPSLQFPSDDHEESATPKFRHCMSFGEAMTGYEGNKLTAKTFITYFHLFYLGPERNLTDWFVYHNTIDYELPTKLHLDFMDDESKNILKEMLQPCILSVGHSTSTRSYKPTFEFYHPTIYARQLGLSQIPPRLVLAELVQPRQHTTNRLEFNRLQDLCAQFKIEHMPDLVFIARTTGAFKRWWKEWCSHLFCKDVSAYILEFDENYELLENYENKLSGPDVPNTEGMRTNPSIPPTSAKVSLEESTPSPVLVTDPPARYPLSEPIASLLEVLPTLAPAAEQTPEQVNLETPIHQESAHADDSTLLPIPEEVIPEVPMPLESAREESDLAESTHANDSSTAPSSIEPMIDPEPTESINDLFGFDINEFITLAHGVGESSVHRSPIPNAADLLPALSRIKQALETPITELVNNVESVQLALVEIKNRLPHHFFAKINPVAFLESNKQKYRLPPLVFPTD